jgi:hypothetical protein
VVTLGDGRIMQDVRPPGRASVESLKW